MEINREIARKVLQTVDAGLVAGIGNPVPGQMCVEAAVCYALGLPHSDDPKCVAQPLRRLKINLNDSNWSSNIARAAGMRKLAILQLGTAGVLDEVAFVKIVAEMTIRKILPIALEKAGLLKEAKRCRDEGTIEAASYAAYVAANAAYVAASAASAASAANAAANAAYYATNAAYSAAYVAANAASAAYAAANAVGNDDVLVLFADEVCSILVDMNVPAVEFLDLI